MATSVEKSSLSSVRDSKVHPHTDFGIPTSNNIRDMLWTQLKPGRTDGSKLYAPKVSLSQLLGLKKCRRYAPDTIILEKRSSSTRSQ